MIQTKDSNLTFRPLTIDDAEQYNALLRYAFQVTEQELPKADGKTMKSSSPNSRFSSVPMCSAGFCEEDLVFTVRGLSAGHDIYGCPLSRRFVTSVCTVPGYNRARAS